MKSGMESGDSGVQQEQAPGFYYCLQAPEKFSLVINLYFSSKPG